MSAILDYTALATELEHEHRHLCAMAELLQLEQHVLVEGDDAERLSSLAAEKISQIRTLGLYAARIAAFLRAQGYADDARGLAECVAAAPKSLEIAELRVKVAEKAREARQLNILNGALIEARLDSVEGRVAKLVGAQAGTSDGGADEATRAAARRALGAV